MSEHVQDVVAEDAEEAVLEAGIHVEQHSPTRVTFHVLKEVWDGLAEVGRIEGDIAKHLDPRVSITVLRIDEARRGRWR